MSQLLKNFNKKERFLALIAVFFIVVQVGLDLKIPDFMEKITVLVQTSGSTVKDIWSIGLLMILCAIGSLASSMMVGFLAARLGAFFSADLRSRLFDKVGSFSKQQLNQFSTSSLITRSTNDVTQMEVLIIM